MSRDVTSSFTEISFINISAVIRASDEKSRFRIEKELLAISFYVSSLWTKQIALNVQSETALNNIFRVNFERKNAIFRTKAVAL